MISLKNSHFTESNSASLTVEELTRTGLRALYYTIYRADNFCTGIYVYKIFCNQSIKPRLQLAPNDQPKNKYFISYNRLPGKGYN